MLIPILIAAVVAVALFLIVVATRPAEFTVSRSLKMAAPPEQIFPHVNDLHQWEPWSPWAKIDPNAKIVFEGPVNGVGAAMSWAGNNQVGEGKMTITDSRTGEQIRFRLDFQRPMKATNTAQFSFRPEAGGTVVTWAMSGKNNFIGKAFGLFCNLDKLLGGQFEKGLASMKALVEKK